MRSDYLNKYMKARRKEGVDRRDFKKTDIEKERRRKRNERGGKRSKRERVRCSSDVINEYFDHCEMTTP